MCNETDPRREAKDEAKSLINKKNEEQRIYNGQENSSLDVNNINNSVLKKEEYKLDWNAERAKAWRKMQPPSKPSKSELMVYEKYINQKKEKVAQPKILILGSTVEFRELAYSLKCKVTVVDYSKSYHDIISNDLSSVNKDNILKSERFILSDWCKLIDNETIKGELSTFDIIIGDLAVGNVPPEELENFFENIAKLLKNDGYLLGKSIYYYTNRLPEKTAITKILDDTVRDIEKIGITNIDEVDKYVYAKTMYNLSIFNTKFDYFAKFGAKQVDFLSMHKQISDYVGEDEKLKQVFNIYLGPETSFSSKMPQNFFIYSYIEIIKLAKKNGLGIFDIEYGGDYYKDDYPLIIFYKTEFNQKNYKIPNNEIVAFLNSNGKFINEWKNSISSRYFLIEIDRIVDNESPFVSLQEIINKLQNLFKGKLVINNNLNLILSKNITYDNIEAETKILVENVPQLKNNPKLQNKLKKNFIYGILIYEAFMISAKNKYRANNVLILLLQELFRDNNETAKGRMWEPHMAPWVAAKICICLYPLFEHFKKLTTKLDLLNKQIDIEQRDELIKEIENQVISSEYETKIRNVVESISSKNGYECDKPKMWHSQMGSDFDASALCLEVLHLYNIYLKNDSIDGKILEILNEYVLNDKIYETFIKYPIYDSLIAQICNQEKFNGEYAFKKLCGRIEWYSILYKICIDKAKNCKRRNERLMYEEPTKFIAEQLKRFWMVFKDQIEKIHKTTINLEKSFIPQILYCLIRSQVLDF